MNYGDLLPVARTRQVLRFLAQSSVPVPTQIPMRAFFDQGDTKPETRLKKCWQVLDGLRKAALIGATTIPTAVGRSPACWFILERGVEALRAYPEGQDLPTRCRAKHQSRARETNRRHEALVQAVKAEVLRYVRLDNRVGLAHLVHDKSAWWNRADGATSVAPDLVAVLEAGGAKTALMVEVQGTASTLRVVSDRARHYAQFVASGAAKAHYGASYFRVVWCTFTDAPDDNIDHAVNVLEAAGEPTGADRLTLVAPVTRVLSDGFGEDVFWRLDDFRRFRSEHPTAFAAGNTRHAANRVRMERDALIAGGLVRRRWHE